jgi:hypothetical protein
MGSTPVESVIISLLAFRDERGYLDVTPKIVTGDDGRAGAIPYDNREKLCERLGNGLISVFLKELIG